MLLLSFLRVFFFPPELGVPCSANLLSWMFVQISGFFKENGDEVVLKLEMAIPPFSHIGLVCPIPVGYEI